MLSNDDYLFSEIRNKNISIIPQSLQNKLYEMQSMLKPFFMMHSGNIDGGKEITLQTGFVRSVANTSRSLIDSMCYEQISDLITNVTNGYLFRQRWQMEHEILEGEQLLDYIVERITLQDSLSVVLHHLILYSLVNSGLRAKDYDTVRKEIIQVNTNSLLDSRHMGTAIFSRCTIWKMLACWESARE